MREEIESILELQQEKETLQSRKARLTEELDSIEDDLSDDTTNESKRAYLKERKSDIYDELEEVNNGIALIEEDLEAVEESDSSENNINPTKSDVEALVNRLNVELSQIKNESEKVQNTQQKISETENRISDLEESAEALLERTTSAALGEQFAERKSQLEENLKYWKMASIGSIFLLVTSAFVIYYDITTNGASALSNISKVALILPVSVAVWFTVSNYSRQKKLMEEYEFKARMALSLSGFREVLKKEVPDEEEALIGEFIVDSMDKIYSNPQNNISSDGNREENPLPAGQGSLVSLIKRAGK